MTSTFRKTTAALVAAATIGLALSPTGASAKGKHHHHHWGYGAAAVGGALLLGSIIASSNAYARECWVEKRKRYDAYGYPYFVRIRVCD